MTGAAYLALENISHAGRDDGRAPSAAQGAMYILRLGRYAEEPDRLLASEEANLPPWANDAVDYFRASDQYMLRKNGRVAQQLTLALPVELEQDEHVALIREYMQAVLGGEALPYTWAYHAGYGHNPHVHILISEAINDGVDRPRERWFRRRANSNKNPAAGGAPKSDRFRGKQVPAQLRGAWEEHANRALARAELDVLIDMRSYKRRGLELRPQVKQGRDLYSALEGQDGRLTMVAAATAHNLQRALENAGRIENKPELLLDLYRHQRTVTRDQLEREIASRCQLDLEQPARVRAALERRLTPLGTDRRGNQLFATREQLCATPELAIRALTLTKSTFTERDLAALFGDDDRGRTALARALVHANIVSLGAVPSTDRSGRELWQEQFTARELLAAEQRLGYAAHALANEHGPRLHSDRVEDAARQLTLDRDGGDEQRRMLHALAGTSEQASGLVLVQGRPGTGKSYVVRALQEVAKPAGIRVIGAAIAGKAAASLGEDAGIETFTIAKLITDLEAGRTNVAGAILVVDEAGMVDTRSLDRLLNAARAAGVGRVALIGDTRQLSPVGAGTPFSRLQQQYPCVLLENIKRQRVDWQRDASRLMSSGKAADIREALGKYARHGAVHELATSDDARSELVRQWLSTRRRSPGASTAVLAHRREDVAALNALIRDALRGQGLLGPDHTFVDGGGSTRHVAVGDQLIFTRADSDLGTRNGTVGRIIAIKKDLLHVRLEDGRTISVDPQQHAHAFEHGFAMTVHRAQGATVDHAFVYASRTFSAETTFVALTRHRESASVFYDRSEFSGQGRTVGGLVDVSTLPEARLFEALSRSQPDLTASEALAAAVRGRPTDAETHLHRFRAAPNDEARSALRQQLEALAHAAATPSEALGQHPAVAAARSSYVAAQQHADRVAARCRARQAHLATSAPRSLRFRSQLDYAQRTAQAELEIRTALAQAQAQSQHAEATLKAVLAHPDVRGAAAASLAMQTSRAEQARRALELIDVDARTMRPLEALHAYGLAENARHGRELYRRATTADRGPHSHHRLIQFVQVDSQSLAVLEAGDGARLLFPVNEKTTRWMTPGDYVGFSAEGPWLEKRNAARALDEIRAALLTRGAADAVPFGSHTPHALELTAVVDLPSGTRFALGRDDTGAQAWVDVTHLPHAASLQAGDRLRYASPVADGGGEGMPRLVRVHAATDEAAVAAQRARLTSLRQELKAIPDSVVPGAADLSLHADGAAVLERLTSARDAFREARFALEAAQPDSPPEALAKLEASCTEAASELQAARVAALSLRQQGDVQMELSRQQGEGRIADALDGLRREQLERELPVLERDLTARAVASELKREGLLARPALEDDRAGRFVLDQVVRRGSHEVAILSAADGSSVVFPVTGHEKAMADLRPGSLVALDRGGRHLFAVAPRDAAQLASEAARLREIVARPRLEKADALAANPDAAVLAGRVRAAREALRVVDTQAAESRALSTARSNYRRAQGELEGLLASRPELAEAARSGMEAAKAEWSRARAELGRIEARLSGPERSALALQVQHDINRTRAIGEPHAREARPSDTGLTFERLESRTGVHLAVLRDGTGARFTHDVTYDVIFRQRAAPGVPVLVTSADKGTRLTLDPGLQRQATSRVLDQLRKEKGPTRLWQETDRSARFVYLGTRRQDDIRIALLGGGDGFTVARELGPKDAELVTDRLVTENARTGGLEQHAKAYYDRLEQRAATLRPRVDAPVFTVEHALAELPETSAAALRVLEATRRVEAARAARPTEVALAEHELQTARIALRAACAAAPTAMQRAEELRTSRGREWHEAARELARVDTQLDALRSDVQERLYHYEHNRALARDAQPLRSMSKEDRECIFERFEHRGGVHIAVLRAADGHRVTTPVRDPNVRELAKPGMTFALEGDGARRSLTPTNPADRAAQRALELGRSRNAPARTRGNR